LASGQAFPFLAPRHGVTELDMKLAFYTGSLFESSLAARLDEQFADSREDLGDAERETKLAIVREQLDVLRLPC
jgi:hypothetical protein